MKIVDDKGKLFGKLNIIDVLVLLVIVAAGIIFGARILGDSGTALSGSGGGDAALITYTVECVRVDLGVYESVQDILAASGEDQLMAGGRLVGDAFVTEVTAKPHATTATVLTEGSGNVLSQVEDTRYVDLTFTIQARVDDSVTNLVGTQEVRVGKTHIVKTTRIELNGIIQDCEWMPVVG